MSSLCRCYVLEELLGSYLGCWVVGFLYWQRRRMDVIYFAKFIALVEHDVYICRLCSLFVTFCKYRYGTANEWSCRYMIRYMDLFCKFVLVLTFIGRDSCSLWYVKIGCCIFLSTLHWFYFSCLLGRFVIFPRNNDLCMRSPLLRLPSVL